MIAADLLTEAVESEKALSREVVGREEIRLLGDNRLTISGKELSVGDSAEEKLRSWLRYPRRLDGAITPELSSRLWNELFQSEIESPKSKIPRLLSIATKNDHVVAMGDANRTRLSFSNVQEALLSVDSDERLADAEVHSYQIDADKLFMQLTFKGTTVEPRVGDTVSGGIELDHDGSAGTTVRQYLHRLVCQNGMVSAVCDGKNLVNRRGNPGIQFATQDAIDDLRRVFTLATERISSKLNGLELLAQQQINRDEVITGFVHGQRLGSNVAERLRAAWEADEHEPIGETMYDFVNAISRLGTHGYQGKGRDLSDSVRDRLMLLSGTLAQQPVHQCPSCQQLLQPSAN